MVKVGQSPEGKYAFKSASLAMPSIKEASRHANLNTTLNLPSNPTKVNLLDQTNSQTFRNYNNKK